MKMNDFIKNGNNGLMLTRIVLLLCACMTLMACDPHDLPSHKVQICNENTINYRYVFSVGYFDKVKDDWISEGWYILNPRECVTPIDGRYNGEVYVHGFYTLFKNIKNSDGSLMGGVKDFLGDLAVIGSKTSIKGNTMFCLHPKNAFKVIGNTRCASRGYKSEGFYRFNIDPHKDALIEFINGGKYQISY